jgi:hypothetical protein
MTAEVLSAGLLGSADVESGTEPVRAQVRQEVAEGAWDPEAFACEQIRGLVRRVFFSNAERPVRQVVFSAIEPQTDVHTVCKSVAEALAVETRGRVAAAGVLPRAVEKIDAPLSEEALYEAASRLRRVPSATQANLCLIGGPEKGFISASALHQYLSQIRREFEFSIVAARATDRFEAIAMSQFADGIVLVLSAQYTRRATARRMKDALAGSRARLLGTVLTDRLFPMPEAIYRRL